MRKCLETCKRLDVTCPVKECRYWINHGEDLNCTLEAVNVNGPMTLREVGDRLDLSYVRIKQIEDKILLKIKKHFE
jgi:DNA-directed RNA polymerase sigma subunit (sigma70/sigma32)|tara:strand:- start:645 stop:872 length:228 start_codon:yes stop_codon:yes gene_type:complete